MPDVCPLWPACGSCGRSTSGPRTRRRGLVVAVSVVVAAGLAVSYANSHTIRQVQIVAADRNPSPARLESALRDVRSGQTLDPSRGTESLSYQASLEIRRGRLPEAL